MDRLLPKNDYFKHSTRRRLSNAQKEEIIAAAERAAERLNSEMIRLENDYGSPVTSVQEGLRRLRQRFILMDRLVALAKGATQPRHLHHKSRRFSIEVEALRIATETGSDFEEVRKVFMERMRDFVSDTP